MDDRRKRLLYRARYRGTKEADAVIGGFFTARVADLTDAQVAEAEVLLEENDLDLMDWVLGREAVPARWQGTLFDQVMTYYRGDKTG